MISSSWLSKTKKQERQWEGKKRRVGGGVGVNMKEVSWAGQVTLTALWVSQELSEEPLEIGKSFDKMAATCVIAYSVMKPRTRRSEFLRQVCWPIPQISSY